MEAGKAECSPIEIEERGLEMNDFAVQHENAEDEETNNSDDKQETCKTMHPGIPRWFVYYHWSSVFCLSFLFNAILERLNSVLAEDNGGHNMRSPRVALHLLSFHAATLFCMLHGGMQSAGILSPLTSATSSVQLCSSPG